MKKLFYNIYSNVTDEMYILIENKLVLVEDLINTALKDRGWHVMLPIRKSEGLIIGFNIKDKEGLQGTFGIGYDDDPEKVSFSCHLSKVFDNDNIRHFLHEIIFKNKSLEYVENDYLNYLNLALTKYNGWTKEDVLNFGEKIDL